MFEFHGGAIEAPPLSQTSSRENTPFNLRCALITAAMRYESRRWIAEERSGLRVRGEWH